jgi:hypothetical protein
VSCPISGSKYPFVASFPGTGCARLPIRKKTIDDIKAPDRVNPFRVLHFTPQRTVERCPFGRSVRIRRTIVDSLTNRMNIATSRPEPKWSDR